MNKIYGILLLGFGMSCTRCTHGILCDSIHPCRKNESCMNGVCQKSSNTSSPTPNNPSPSEKKLSRCFIKSTSQGSYQQGFCTLPCTKGMYESCPNTLFGEPLECDWLMSTTKNPMCVPKTFYGKPFETIVRDMRYSCSSDGNCTGISYAQ